MLDRVSQLREATKLDMGSRVLDLMCRVLDLMCRVLDLSCTKEIEREHRFWKPGSVDLNY